MSASPQSHQGSDYGSDIDLPDHLDPPLPNTTTDGLSSDYGSDIDLSDSTLLNLLDKPPLPPPPSPLLYPPLPIENDFTGLAKIRVKTSTRFGRDGTLVVQYDELVTVDHPAPTTAAAAEEIATTLPTISDAQPRAPGTRSPYERFRSRRGQLSVTDLVSNVWCEQQFMYTLERGFKRTTPAMRRGTKLHKVLEEQVHTTVPVEIRTREDAWGLRLFNMCQGLVSLEKHGMTRELEVFGWLGGIFVNGVIDEITYNHPKPEMLQQTQGESQAPTTAASDAGDDPFMTCPSSPINTPSLALPSTSPTRIAYITDTKTRTVPTVPKTSQLSTSLQLSLYYTLLASLPSAPFTSFLEHHNLSPTASFSDSFIAQVGSMDSPISLSLLLENNSLPGLWELFLVQYRKAIERVGDVVGVTYRSQGSGRVIAECSWRVDDEARERHLVDVMSWWKGERGTKGVVVEEAWKCRTCEFEETCSWRLGKLEEIRKIMRARLGAGEKADVVVNAEVKETVEEGVKTDVLVNPEGKKTVGDGVKGRRGRPRKNVEAAEKVLEKENTHSGDSEVSTKKKRRERSRPRKTGPAAEKGKSKGKEQGRGTSEKGKSNSVSEMELF